MIYIHVIRGCSFLVSKSRYCFFTIIGPLFFKILASVEDKSFLQAHLFVDISRFSIIMDYVMCDACPLAALGGACVYMNLSPR
jgi:hypothetical protein